MTAAIAAEVRKTASLTTIRQCVLLGLTGIAAVSWFGVLQTISYTQAGRPEDTGGIAAADWPLLALHYGQVIPVLLGAWIFGQDMATGTRRMMFLASSSRIRIACGKMFLATLLTSATALVCSLGALTPFLGASERAADGVGGFQLSPARFGWLIGYWVVIALLSAAITAATRNTVIAVAPLLIWTIGLSDLLTNALPSLKIVFDQVFKTAYQSGFTPSASELTATAIQLIVVMTIGAVIFIRRDCG
ncbi:hypothetical protein [Actinomyces sp. Z5]|uniref:hypothetical protein n=1 Tax=Actinomyces sp. Z5 TaxID=2250216 RepID=UPI0011BDDF2C|nr:hypothetical protein [Actinomyces sp. Z5]